MPAKLTIDQWKSIYLYGIPDVDPSSGIAFPDANYQYHLDYGYAALEMALDLSILPITITDERHDYYVEDYQQWGYIRLFKKPVVSITNLEGKYPYFSTSMVIPSEWITVDQNSGIVNLIPVSGSLSQFIMTGGGDIMPNLFRYQSHIPRFWSIDYTAGFATGAIPPEINDAAAKMACMSVLNILGDLIGGVGVLGSSIGLDGLSQFLSLTKTATTSAFYSRVLQYRTELFGNGNPGPGSQIHLLKRRYRGIRLTNL